MTQKLVASGHTVEAEPTIKTDHGVRRPDVVAYKPGESGYRRRDDRCGSPGRAFGRSWTENPQVRRPRNSCLGFPAFGSKYGCCHSDIPHLQLARCALSRERAGHEGVRHLSADAGTHVSYRVEVGPQSVEGMSRCDLGTPGRHAQLPGKHATTRWRHRCIHTHWWIEAPLLGGTAPASCRLKGDSEARAPRSSLWNVEAWTAPTGTGRYEWCCP